MHQPHAPLPVLLAHSSSPTGLDTMASPSLALTICLISDSMWLNQLCAVGEQDPASGHLTPCLNSFALSRRALAVYTLAILPKSLLEEPGWDWFFLAIRP